MSTATILTFCAGLALLVGGAEALVRGASRLAAALGISPLVIGLTVVAYGTSAPELAVGIQSALAGQPDLAIGNVVGSNIFNVLFILGISALVAPLAVSQQLIRIDVPLMIATSIAVLLMALDGSISRLDGAILMVGMLAYTAFAIVKSRRESPKVQEEYEREFGGGMSRRSFRFVDPLLVVAGLGLLVLGSNWLVLSAVRFAEFLGVDQLVIGLTIVAAGTSLPELATSVVASIRGERDIAVGNVIGSNLFNLLSVLGATALFSRLGIPVARSAIQFDLPVMVAVAVACLPIFFTGRVISRLEGALFFGYYIAYSTYLVLRVKEHASLGIFSNTMLCFVVPITVVTLLIPFLRSRRSETGGARETPDAAMRSTDDRRT